jgi:hypothetical protein
VAVARSGAGVGVRAQATLAPAAASAVPNSKVRVMLIRRTPSASGMRAA